MAVDVHTLTSALRPRLSDVGEGKFGRMFPDLPRHEASDEVLVALGRAEGLLAEASPDDDANRRIPAGWAFFGQFIAHDVTHDRAPLQQHEEVGLLRNFRTPRLDLECIYGAGPVGQPYMYDTTDPDKLLIGTNDVGLLEDLPRNAQSRGIVGDARNDTHVFCSQLHLAFLKLHNAIVDMLREEGVAAAGVFERAQQLARWHYQWIVVHEFLPLSVGPELVAEILDPGPRFSERERPFIPVEFSDGAYRFGHAQICDRYDLNCRNRDIALFPDLIGACPVTHDHVVDWTRFFRFDNFPPPQPSRLIRPHMASALLQLPEQLTGHVERPEHGSLAYRDLQRARSVDMPSGEAVARAMGLTPPSPEQLGFGAAGWEGETPLWLYVLKEAEVRTGGQRLAEVGGRIVAEVLLGLIEMDPSSYRNVPNWRPTLPAATEADFTVTDLLNLAGVGPDSANGVAAAGRPRTGTGTGMGTSR